jgi:hypothetical protein
MRPARLGRLASAEVAEGPSSVPQHRQLVVLVEEHEERLQRSCLEDDVSAFRRVSSDVSKRPNAESSMISIAAEVSGTYACSRTSKTVEPRSWMKRGMAPLAMTTCVC